jgi:ATP-binding cassette subfamily B protein
MKGFIAGLVKKRRWCFWMRFASLDPENEVLIQQAVSRLIEGKTVIVIAHRLRTVAGADKIIVLDQGRVVEEGTHEALIGQKGLYERLYRIQQESLGWSV